MSKNKKTPQLSKSLDKKRFIEIEKTFRGHFQLPLETTNACGVIQKKFCSSDCHPEFCRLVRSSPTGLKRCNAERRRSLAIAIETGQSYISICHAGIVLVCVPVMDRDQPLAGMYFGKCLWQPVNDVLIDDIEKRLKGLRIDRPQLTDAINKLEVTTGKTIQRAADFLFQLLYEVGGFDPRVIRWRRYQSQQQAEIGEYILEKKKLGTDWRYPLESERELISKVKIGDRSGAREILNSILGTILFHDPGELGILKARIIELLSILSRSAVEGGVDVNTMLEKNLNYVTRIMQFDTQEDLCAWIGMALNEFIELVYSSQDAKKITQVQPAINYIDANYDKPVTLAEVAKACHLSVSRLAHLFKEQMGITVIDYLTSVRIERAKQMLLSTDQNCTEICFQVGYSNQSYFTRTFKDMVGMTPRQFRVRNRRKEKMPITM
jgi:two-component system response regulator YesN